MKKIALFIILVGIIEASPRVLHLSLHQGCINDIAAVAQELDWQLITWNPLSSYQSAYRFLGTQTEPPMVVYNMTRERAARIWQANKEYFNSFDLIITSDIAPLSRIFLQHDFKKPLIIWVCNRFNYCVGPGSEHGFDAQYYQLFQKAMQMPNVKVVAYTPFEHYFAALYKTDIRGPIIKPIGSKPGVCSHSAIPNYVTKSETIFVWPGFSGCKKEHLAYIKKQCGSLGFATYSGHYNGPDDLTEFKGVIYFPYQASNIALFENLQRGIVHFVPSERFIRELIEESAPIYYWHEPYYCEWYFGEHRDVIVYFDSWADLAHKVATTDYTALRPKIRAFGTYHRQRMVGQWQGVIRTLKIDEK